MRCTLLISDLLLPPALGGEPYQDLRLDALETMLARGNLVLQPPLERDAWLCREFSVAKQRDWPVAALTLAGDGVDPGRYYWLRADPVELRTDRNRLVLAGGVSDLDASETHDLIAALNRHFARDGIAFLAPFPQRWYLRMERAPGIATTPLARAANRDVDRHLPQGDDALDWHRVINEAQMVLHAHAVNAAREARGATAVNSVWLWGGGTMPAAVKPAWAAAWSDDVVTRALAAATETAHHGLPDSAAAWLGAAPAGGDHHLLVFARLSNALHAGGIPAWREQLVLLERDWMAPMLAALRAGKIPAIALVASNSANLLEVTLTPSQRWRLWRRAQPLVNYAGAG